MQLHLAYDAADSSTARDVVRQQIREWHLSASPLLDWFDQADAAVPQGSVANIEIRYHPADRLLSLDVWASDRRVFGADDVV